MKAACLFVFVRGLLKSLLSPLPLFWLILIVGFVFYLAGKKKIARWLFGFSIIWILLISTPFLPKRMLTMLENQYPPIQLPIEKVHQAYAQDSVVHILVLGSGYETDDRLPYSSQLYSSGLARLVESIRLYRLIPSSRLIFSGYAGSQPLPQAKISAMAAQELGIDSTVIYTICKPWNTKNEAAEYLKRFGKTYKLYLITDAAHMPRAIRHFRNAGLKPIPAPANFMIRKNSIPRSYTEYFPGSHNIRFMEIVFQEYLGMLWATMGGD